MASLKLLSWPYQGSALSDSEPIFAFSLTLLAPGFLGGYTSSTDHCQLNTLGSDGRADSGLLVYFTGRSQPNCSQLWSE